MSSLGTRLREYRLSLKLTQEQLGEMLGVSDVYISQIERGKRPSYTIIALFCELFLVRKEWLLDGEEPVHETPENVINKLSQLDRQTVTEVAARLYEKYLKSVGTSNEAVRSDPDLVLIFTYLETLWNLNPDMRGWLKVQFKEAFPKFEEWRESKSDETER